MNNPRWLDESEQRAWRSYLQMHGQLLARLNRQLQADSDLSLADYEVLVTLSEVPAGRLRPFELQRGLQWEQSRLSHQLRRMEHRGLVGREGCTDDRRGAFIVLTDAGRRAIEAAAPTITTPLVTPCRISQPAPRLPPTFTMVTAAVTTAAVEVEKPRWSTCNVGRKPMTAYQQHE